jgi:hypothetical protein
MIEFRSNNLEDLEMECLQEAHKIAKYLIETVCDALDNNVDRVPFGAFETSEGERIVLNIEEPTFLRILEVNIERVEEAEEYELCARATQWIETLKTNQ